jgi:hypothetical protein
MKASFPNKDQWSSDGRHQVAWQVARILLQVTGLYLAVPLQTTYPPLARELSKRNEKNGQCGRTVHYGPCELSLRDGILDRAHALRQRTNFYLANHFAHGSIPLWYRQNTLFWQRFVVRNDAVRWESTGESDGSDAEQPDYRFRYSTQDAAGQGVLVFASDGGQLDRSAAAVHFQA